VSKPYDATSKDLIETDPAGWVTFLGCSVSPDAVRLVEADVSTVTAEADKVIRVDGPAPWLLHLELQASRDAELSRRLLRYNALLQHRHELPVASVAVLLRTEANDTGLTGAVAVDAPVGPRWDFRYGVVRVWERPADEFLTGPLGLVPFAPLANVRPPELSGVIDRMRGRIDTQPDRPLAAKLWTASSLLMGLRYEQPLIDNLLAGVRQMEESVVYQAILNRGVQQGLQQGSQQGAVNEARKLLLLSGQTKFGPPGAAIGAAVNAITDLGRLEALVPRVHAVSSWDELLQSE
jgi:predicted transposase YdaD